MEINRFFTSADVIRWGIAVRTLDSMKSQYRINEHKLFLHRRQMLSFQPVNAMIICKKTDQVQLHGLSHTDQPFLIHLNQYSLVVFSPDHIGKRNLPFVDEGQRSPVHPVAFASLIEKPFSIQNIVNLVLIFIKSDSLC